MSALTSDRQTDRLTELEERKKQAWAVYSEDLRDLEGKDYDEAEGESWERLQGTLLRLEEERQLVETS